MNVSRLKTSSNIRSAPSASYKLGPHMMCCIHQRLSVKRFRLHQTDAHGQQRMPRCVIARATSIALKRPRIPVIDERQLLRVCRSGLSTARKAALLEPSLLGRWEVRPVVTSTTTASMSSWHSSWTIRAAKTTCRGRPEHALGYSDVINVPAWFGSEDQPPTSPSPTSAATAAPTSTSFISTTLVGRATATMRTIGDYIPRPELGGFSRVERKVADPRQAPGSAD